MRPQIFRVGLLTLVLLAPCAIRAQQIMITPVALSVTDPTGAPIPQAHVLVYRPTQMFDDTTDEHGHAFLHLQTGNYGIAVYKPGYESATVDITVTPVENSADKCVTVVLQLDDFGWVTPAYPTSKGSSFKSKFKLIRMANGFTKDGYPSSENLHLGPDGEEVSFRIIHYHSAGRVKEEFEAVLKDSVKVIDHRKAIDMSGNVRSEMAVITRALADQKDLAMIIITSGEDLHIVRSDSLQDVLAVAKDLKPLAP